MCVPFYLEVNRAENSRWKGKGQIDFALHSLSWKRRASHQFELLLKNFYALPGNIWTFSFCTYIDEFLPTSLNLIFFRKELFMMCTPLKRGYIKTLGSPCTLRYFAWGVLALLACSQDVMRWYGACQRCYKISRPRCKISATTWKY